VRIVEAALRDAERALEWGRAAADAAPDAGDWRDAVAALFDAAAGGEPIGAVALRSAAGPPEPDRVVRRDERFRDVYNQSALIDAYCEDEERPADERAYALAYKRLREMDVPEWLAPIIADSDGPFERRRELSRQLWDETRHAMMGQVALERHAVPFHSFPDRDPGLDGAQHALHAARGAPAAVGDRAGPDGGGHRQEARARGRRAAWRSAAHDVPGLRLGRRGPARPHGPPLDRVRFPGRAEAEAAARDVWRRYDEVAAELAERSGQSEWWPDFLAAMRAGAPLSRSRG
jgi:hypothetical protein